MNKQVLSVEQTRHLEELGLRTDIYKSTLLWWKQKGEWKLYATDSCEAHPSCDILIPAYTLQDVLDALPEEIKFKRKYYHIEMWLRDGEWSIAYLHFTPDDTLYAHLEQDKEILKAAYEMLCWCIKEGHITKN